MARWRAQIRRRRSGRWERPQRRVGRARGRGRRARGWIRCGWG
uniref:Uncharacterized protein n=1 Tax=Arundo donax TaxID=35708 RepID=A0A0A9EGA6_ARUDO